MFNDTLLLKNRNNPTVNFRVPKLIREISIREPHNYLVSKSSLGVPEVYDDKGKVLISDTAFRSLIPPNIKKMSNKYKQMCGCEICIMAKSHQLDLNAYRLSLLRRLEKSGIDREKSRLYKHSIYKDNKHLHIHPKDALKCIQCPNVTGFSTPKMECILRTCKDCPKYRHIITEKDLTNIDPKISFHSF